MGPPAPKLGLPPKFPCVQAPRLMLQESTLPHPQVTLKPYRSTSLKPQGSKLLKLVILLQKFAQRQTHLLLEPPPGILELMNSVLELIGMTGSRILFQIVMSLEKK